MHDKEAQMIIGKKLVGVRPMTQQELTDQGWYVRRYQTPPPVLVFEGGVTLFPVRDD
jgi:hypothetical protein